MLSETASLIFLGIITFGGMIYMAYTTNEEMKNNEKNMSKVNKTKIPTKTKQEKERDDEEYQAFMKEQHKNNMLLYYTSEHHDGNDK